MKKSILVDAHSFDGAGQGVVSYIQGVYAELLDDERFEITFACSYPEKVRHSFGDNVNIIKIPRANFLYRLLFFFPRLLKSGKYQYAHFQYILPFFLNKKVRYIATIHDIIPLDFPKLYPLLYRLKVAILFRCAAKKSDIVCTVSEYSKKRIAARFKVDERKIRVTPNAVKSVFKNMFDKSESPIKRPYLLFVSRIEERKNHLLLLKAFVDYKFYKNYDLVFVGKNCSKNKALFAFVKFLPSEIRTRLHFVSDISDMELFSYYQNAALFVYPSLAEGFGIPPLEAALMGCKVLCSNATAMADFDFFEPYLFPPASEKVLAEKIELALADDNYCEEERKTKILEKYSWEKSANTFKNAIFSASSRDETK